MKYIILFFTLITLANCAFLGITRNDYTKVYNSSGYNIIVNTDYDDIIITPYQNSIVKSKEFLKISSTHPSCTTQNVPRKFNRSSFGLDAIVSAGLITAAIVYNEPYQRDMVGFATGYAIIAILMFELFDIDKNLHETPKEYNYTCEKLY
ncbi:MAG: hypothetical protein LBQ34_01775 [Alphaproteobacteria bacterium]|jgi:hypothetical protein|nr:hypothetical protein [Alphaproteobacteria bacterium]